MVVGAEVIVHTDRHGNKKLISSHPSSPESLCSSMFDTQPEGKPAEQLDEGGGSRPQQHRTVPGGEDLGNVSKNGTPNAGLMDLIQFFKKTPPPPTNLMSIPDNFSASSEEDKWDKFKTKVFRRRSSKNKKRRPPIIMLPDSAVAARSTDGHRYIEISIPTEHSPMAPLPNSQYPIYDSVEAAFHREVNSRFGMWKNVPSNRPVTVLNPVFEDHRESASTTSLPSTASEQPGQKTVIPGRTMRIRPHSVSLLPSREQRYTPRNSRDLVKIRSAGDARPVSQPSDPTTANAQNSDVQRNSIHATGTPQQGRQETPAGTSPKDTSVGEPSIVRVVEKPMITLTLPSRTSSRRGKQLEPVPPERTEHIINTGRASIVSIDDAYNNGNGFLSGVNSGSAPRGSFAASIQSTNSSPQILKAQTAIAFHSVPIIVRSTNGDVESPLDLNFPQPPLGQGTVSSPIRTSLVGPPPPAVERSKSRKQKVREKKQRDLETQNVRMEHEEKGKGKEAASQPFGFTPGMPGALPATPPDHDRHHEGEYTSSASPSSSASSPDKSSESTHDQGLDRSASYASQKAQRREREARYMAKVLAERRETLENLPREELIQRYDALREQRIYEREKRLRKLERSRDTWARAVPMLLQDLNGLLREQHRILAAAGLTHAFPAPAGPSHYRQEEHHRHHRRRSRSAEVSSRSALSDHSLDPLETRRSRSLHSSESRSGRQSSSLHSG
ncbi:hypothetical protein F5Y10DRAFT_267407 [Nemania abortiva]|nr:hypothetical protein F5Y10DRAFT_267407 [Nemania abortiva]